MSNRGARLVRLALSLGVVAGCSRHREQSVDWRVTGGEPGNSRYSSLEQINRRNVAQLHVAWTYHTGDAGHFP